MILPPEIEPYFETISKLSPALEFFMHSLKLGLRTDIDSRDMHLEGITTRDHRAAPGNTTH